MDLPRPFGPYTLLRRLAVGGMAEIYVGKTRGLGGFEKLVAIKVIHPRYSEDAHFIQMLVEEAKLAVLLNHVNVAQIFDLRVEDESDTYYIVMEFVEGADTSRLLSRTRELGKKLPFDVCAHIAAEVCNGLDYAHRRKDSSGRPLSIVHRDISPQNVMVSFAGEVKVVDFGIAKAARRSTETEVGVIKGKYYYMSPEQAWADPVDHRSDIFSTGVVLHELLTGDMLYQENNLPDLLAKVRKAEIAPPSTKRTGIPPELDEILMKALAARPEDRYQSAFDFGQALTQFVYGYNASFTSGRMAALMAEAFSAELAQATATIRLPSSERVLTSNLVTDGGGSTEEHSLPPMRAEEFLPDAAKSVIFELEEDERDHMTRRDIPPYRRAAKVAQQVQPAPRAESLAETRDGKPASPEPDSVEESDDEEDKTIVQTGGPELWRSLGLVPRASTPSPSGQGPARVTADPTMVDPSGDMARRVREGLKRPRAAAARPSAPPPVLRPSVPPPVLRPSAPPPVLRPSAPPPVLRPSAPPPVLRPSAPPPRPPTTSPGPLFAPDLLSGAPASLPKEGPHHQPPPAPGPAPPGAFARQPAFAAPGTLDAAPTASLDPATPLRGIRSWGPAWMGSVRRHWRIYVAALVVALVALVALLAGSLLGSPGPTLDVLSQPSGAVVRLDGVTLEDETPVTGIPVEQGHEYRLELVAPGYERSEVRFVARGGNQVRNVQLEQERVTLHIEAEAQGLRVSVNGSPPAALPLDVPGLLPGSSARILVTDSAGQTRELSHRLTAGELNVIVVDPPPGSVTPAPAPPPTKRRVRHRWRSRSRSRR